jgi:fucose permease
VKKQLSPLIAGLLLLIVYLSYASLGLPDALLSSGWNLIRQELNADLGTLGYMTLLGYSSSALSMFFAPKILKLVPTRMIALIAISTISISLLIMSQVNAFYQLLLFAFPLGFSGGALNVALNNFLTANYKASHMSYLHSFYGLGVTLGPTIMAFTLSFGSWRAAYLTVSLILGILATLVLLTFKWWQPQTKNVTDNKPVLSVRAALKNKDAKQSIAIFFTYVHLETLFAVWVPSYMFITKQVSLSTAALYTTTFYLCLTVSRMLSGIFSNRIKPKQLIYFGISLILISTVAFSFNYMNKNIYFVITGLLGLGAGPIYPNMMFLNRERFSSETMSRYISLQLLIGNMGGGLLTPVIGQIFQRTNIIIMPIFLLVTSLLLTINILLYFKDNGFTISQKKEGRINV